MIDPIWFRAEFAMGRETFTVMFPVPRGNERYAGEYRQMAVDEFRRQVEKIIKDATFAFAPMPEWANNVKIDV